VWPQHCPQHAAGILDLGHQPVRANDDTGKQVIVPGQILSRAVNDQIEPQRQRL